MRGSQIAARICRAKLHAGAPDFGRHRDLTSRIYADFRYDSTATTVYTPLEQVLKLRRGVCQDLAHIEVGCLRAMGLASRYVSGYLLTQPPPGKPRLIGADASHAWISVFTGDAGWIDFDPTNNVSPGDEHITLAWGRDYSDVCPIEGVYVGGGAEHPHRAKSTFSLSPARATICWQRVNYPNPMRQRGALLRSS